jgi:hypothetical protein
LPGDVARYLHGADIPIEAEPDLILRVYDGARFLGLGRVIGGCLRAVVNLQV